MLKTGKNFEKVYQAQSRIFISQGQIALSWTNCIIVMNRLKEEIR